MMKTSAPALLLTRPIDGAHSFAEALRRAGVTGEIVISPLMQIVFEQPEQLPRREVMIFTSVHGVAGYLAAGGQGIGEAYVVGEATAGAARDAGFDIVAEEPDLARLRPRLEAETRAMLHARGRLVTADLTQVMPNVEAVIVYDQRARGLSDDAKALLEREGRVIVPLFSPRSAALFADAVPQGRAAKLTAVFMSEAVRAAGAKTAWESEAVAPIPDAAQMCALCAKAMIA